MERGYRESRVLQGARVGSKMCCFLRCPLPGSGGQEGGPCLGDGGCSHPQVSPSAVWHLVGAELLYLVHVSEALAGRIKSFCERGLGRAACPS